MGSAACACPSSGSVDPGHQLQQGQRARPLQRPRAPGDLGPGLLVPVLGRQEDSKVAGQGTQARCRAEPSLPGQRLASAGWFSPLPGLGPGNQEMVLRAARAPGGPRASVSLVSAQGPSPGCPEGTGHLPEQALLCRGSCAAPPAASDCWEPKLRAQWRAGSTPRPHSPTCWVLVAQTAASPPPPRLGLPALLRPGVPKVSGPLQPTGLVLLGTRSRWICWGGPGSLPLSLLRAGLAPSTE